MGAGRTIYGHGLAHIWPWNIPDGRVTKTGFGKVVFSGGISCPDGTDMTQDANDVYWLTGNHGSADVDHEMVLTGYTEDDLLFH